MASVRVLAAGLDRLEVGWRGVVPPATRGRLEELAAKRDDEGDRPTWELGGRRWTVHRGGRFHGAALRCGELTALVTREGLARNPAVSWEVGSRPLWERGWRACWEEAHELTAELLAAQPGGAVVRRVDLAVDVTGAGFAAAARADWVTKRRVDGERGAQELAPGEGEGEAPGDPAWEAWRACAAPNSLRFGTGGAAMLRIYDKRREIRESSGKHWFVPIWAQALPGEEVMPEDVWRVEAQLRREALKGTVRVDGRAVSVDTVDGLEAAIPELWRRETEHVRWCVPKGKNRGRWPLRPEWAAISGADWSRSSRFAGRDWIAAEAQAEDVSRLLPILTGYLKRWAVVVGALDLDLAVWRLRDDVRELLDRRGTTWDEALEPLIPLLRPDLARTGSACADRDDEAA